MFTVFWRNVTEHRAEVYLQCAPGCDAIEGFLEGPFRADARTLPARFPLRFLGQEPTPLARAVIVDPCCWAPANPTTYQLRAQWRNADGAIVEAAPRRLGLRNLEARTASLYWGGRRWVFRGVAETPSDRAACVALADERGGLAAKLDDFSPEIAQWCDELGVPVALFAQQANLEATFALAMEHPAIWCVLVDHSTGASAVSIRDRCAPHVLLGWFGDPSDVGGVPEWAALRCIRVPEAKLVDTWRPGDDAPCIIAADRDQSSNASPRAQCDTLQARMARHGDFAGFVIL